MPETDQITEIAFYVGITSEFYISTIYLYIIYMNENTVCPRSVDPYEMDQDFLNRQ